jgi:NAD+ kinase
VLAVAGHRVSRVSIDGRDSGVADIGDAVVCTAAPDSARLVTFGHRDFHRVLRAKFGLADR